jgi:hypothetical protein
VNRAGNVATGEGRGVCVEWCDKSNCQPKQQETGSQTTTDPRDVHSSAPQ